MNSLGNLQFSAEVVVSINFAENHMNHMGNRKRWKQTIVAQRKENMFSLLRVTSFSKGCHGNHGDLHLGTGNPESDTRTTGVRDLVEPGER